jgi:hypothetical protein
VFGVSITSSNMGRLMHPLMKRMPETDHTQLQPDKPNGCPARVEERNVPPGCHGRETVEVRRGVSLCPAMN